MKSILSLLLLVLAFPILSFSQIHKETTKIIVKNELSSDDNYKLVGKELIENGYEIETADKDFGSIRTTEVEGSVAFTFKNWHYLNVSTYDNKIVISGKFAIDENAVISPGNEKKGKFNDIFYHKKPKNMTRKWFEEMLKLAKSIEGEISFK